MSMKASNSSSGPVKHVTHLQSETQSKVSQVGNTSKHAQSRHTNKSSDKNKSLGGSNDSRFEVLPTRTLFRGHNEKSIRLLFLERRKQIGIEHKENLDNAEAKAKATAAAAKEAESFKNLGSPKSTSVQPETTPATPAVNEEEKDKLELLNDLHPTADYVLDAKIYLELLQQTTTISNFLEGINELIHLLWLGGLKVQTECLGSAVDDWIVSIVILRREQDSLQVVLHALKYLAVLYRFNATNQEQAIDCGALGAVVECVLDTTVSCKVRQWAVHAALVICVNHRDNQAFVLRCFGSGNGEMDARDSTLYFALNELSSDEHMWKTWRENDAKNFMELLFAAKGPSK